MTQPQPQPARSEAGVAAQRSAQAGTAVRTSLKRHCAPRGFRLGRKDIHKTMQRIRPVGRRAGTADDLDAARQAVRGFKQTIDIGEASGAQRHPVLKIEKTASPLAAYEDRRADRSEMLGAVPAMQID